MTIRGAGMEKSILSFAGQVAGAEGLSVNASDFLIEDLAIEDTIGDALKINEGNNIVIRRVRTEWTNGPDVNNGAYGISRCRRPIRWWRVRGDAVTTQASTWVNRATSSCATTRPA